MTLFYLSPINWDSIKQRPHYFVNWLHKRTLEKVIWIDPYPTRLPNIKDLKRFSSSSNDFQKNDVPEWIKIKKNKALPIEPINLINYLNNPIWNSLIKELKQNSSKEDSLIIGKPSKFALIIIKKLNFKIKIYDAMDDFPYFYNGLSFISQQKNLKKLLDKVDIITTSSINLSNEYQQRNLKTLYIKNGGDFSNLPKINLKRNKKRLCFGYIGTIAKWFDWEWIKAIGEIAYTSRIKLIGPLYVDIPNNLPSNIEIYPPVNNKNCLEIMNDFSIGLIPFKINQLTENVDPIKFYEYKALGLPVISTNFGSMRYKNNEKGLYVSHSYEDINLLIEKALNYKIDQNDLKKFIKDNSWDNLFDKSNLLKEII